VWRDELTELLQDAVRLDLQDEDNLSIRENITNRIHEIGILLFTKAQSELDHGDQNYVLISYQLGENMREVYGKPDPEHWRGILGYRLSKLAAIEKADDVPSEILEAWNFVKEALPKDLPIAKTV